MRLLIIFLALSTSIQALSQRYLDDTFAELDSTIAGTYGTAVDYQGEMQELLFDFYEPKGDASTKRPLIIYIHGGGFTTGSRTLLSIKMLCRRMAKKGYAVANIDYRLDPNFEFYNSATDRRAMTDAMHDAKQAIRYFKANAATYKIDTSNVFIGGESAGAVTSMMAAFLDKQSEMAFYPMANPNDPVGSTTNSNVSNNVKGAMCLCGTLLDTLAIEKPTDPDILWTHGSADNFISLALAFNVVRRAANLGVTIQTKVYDGATHCPWFLGNPQWDVYLDSTVNDITSFLYPRVKAESVVSVQKIETKDQVYIYPNPFDDHFRVKIHNSNAILNDPKIRVISSNGKAIDYNATIVNDELTIQMRDAKTGLYFLIIESEEGRIVRTLTKTQ